MPSIIRIQSKLNASKIATVGMKIPEFDEAVKQGEMTISNARRVAPILNDENKEVWIAEAKELPRAQFDFAKKTIKRVARDRT